MRDKSMTKHHRVPRSRFGSDDPSNIAMVPQNLHVAYHQLFGVGDASYVAYILNTYWIDPKVKLVVKKK